MYKAQQMESLALTPDAAIALCARRARAVAEVYRSRVVVGIAGGPGVGKSTMAAALVERLNLEKPGIAALVPMDGFHIRHDRLVALGRDNEKGAPETFEAAAFVAALDRLRTARESMFIPGYSRAIEDVVENAHEVPAAARILVVEGNYLLLAEPPWGQLRRLIELAVFLDVPRDMVRARLLRRHAEHGLFTPERIVRHVDNVDLPNYDRVAPSRARADLGIDLVTES